jgi:hypothetical protein
MEQGPGKRLEVYLQILSGIDGEIAARHKRFV